MTSLTASIIQAQSYRVLREAVTAVLLEFSLDPRTWSILSVLLEHPEGIRSLDVAKQLNVRAPLITMRTKELITAGYVASEKHDEDFRSKYLQLSETGRTFIAHVDATLNKRLQQLVRNVSNEDLQTYFRVLNAIIANGRSRG